MNFPFVVEAQLSDEHVERFRRHIDSAESGWPRRFTESIWQVPPSTALKSICAWPAMSIFLLSKTCFFPSTEKMMVPARSSMTTSCHSFSVKSGCLVLRQSFAPALAVYPAVRQRRKHPMNIVKRSGPISVPVKLAVMV